MMYSITKNNTHMYQVFSLLGALQCIWAVLMFFCIDEPNIYTEKEAKRAGRKSFCGKVWSLMKLVYKACKADKALFIGIIASNIARNQSMLQQITYNEWLYSYVEADVITVDA